MSSTSSSSPSAAIPRMRASQERNAIATAAPSGAGDEAELDAQEEVVDDGARPTTNATIPTIHATAAVA